VSEAIGCVASFYPAMPWPDYAPDWSRYAGKSAIVHKALTDEATRVPPSLPMPPRSSRHDGSLQTYDYPDSVHAFFNDARPEVFQPGTPNSRGRGPLTSSAPVGPEAFDARRTRSIHRRLSSVPATDRLVRGGRAHQACVLPR